MKFVKKPIVVEALKLEKDMFEGELAVHPELRDLMVRFPKAFQNSMRLDSQGLRITTVDGNRVNIPWGAYLVMDSKGYAYPCDAEIFEANHRVAVSG